MKIVTLQHEPFMGLGVIRSWAESHGHRLVPLQEEYDLLVVLGGTMGAEECSSLEKAAIERAIFTQKNVVGIGLGAQLIGDVLGAPPEKSPEREYGFYEVEMEGADRLTDHFPERFRAMHWHREMPGLPVGAEVLGFSEGCPRQVIRFQEGVYGFQCHLEMTPFDIQKLVQKDYANAGKGSFVMEKKAIELVHCAEINSTFWHFLSNLEKVNARESQPKQT